MKIGSLLKRSRVQRGLSLGALGRLADVSAATLCRIENHGTGPSPSLLYRLTQALELSSDEVFQAAGILPPDVTRWLLATPGAIDAVREKMRAAA